MDSTDFSTVAWAKVDGTKAIVDQSGGWTISVLSGSGQTVLDHPNVDESSVGFAASIYRADGEGTAPGFVSVFANDADGFQVRTYDADGVASDEGYTIVAPLTPGDLATPLSVTTSPEGP